MNVSSAGNHPAVDALVQVAQKLAAKPAGIGKHETPGQEAAESPKVKAAEATAGTIVNTKA
jgi:hypothetical protein